jgi:hypothetical protein
MKRATKQPFFPLGQVVATPGALATLKKAGQDVSQFLSLHVFGDWGEMPDEIRARIWRAQSYSRSDDRVQHRLGCEIVRAPSVVSLHLASSQFASV